MTMDSNRLGKHTALAVLVSMACGVKSVGDLERGSSSGGSAGSSEGSEGPSSTGSASGSESGSGSTTDASSGESGEGPIELGCADPQPLLQFDEATPSGFVVCSDGFRHREAAVACVVPESSCDECESDCSELPLGRCVSDLGLGSCSCVASCETDADCGDGRVCACTGATGDIPRCVPAECTTTADCGNGLCGFSGSNGCGFDATLTCLDESSQCRVTVCDDQTECACYASGGQYVCHDECFSGCG